MSSRDGSITLADRGVEVHIDPQRGGEIRFLGRPGGANLLFWSDWSTPVPASTGGGYGNDEQDWLSEWRGGWQELFPNAGAASCVLAARLPFHGEVSGLPWEVLEHDSHTLVIRTATRLPLTLTRTMRLGGDGSSLLIEEVAQNESDIAVPVLRGHHPAFDAVAGTRIDLPPCRTVVPADFDVAHADLKPGDGKWPMAASRNGGAVDLSAVPRSPAERVVYLTDLDPAWYALRRPDGGGIGLTWDRSVFPHAWMWTEIGGEDFPWYGRARVIAIEPASSWPNSGLAAARERGQGHVIAPRAGLETWLTVALFDDDGRAVAAVDRLGTVTRES